MAAPAAPPGGAAGAEHSGGAANFGELLLSVVRAPG
jgi:hypothetical protein